MRDVYLCDYIRTPFGRYGGALSSIRTDDLAARPLLALHLLQGEGRLALATLCIGVGQGIALARERV